MSWEEIKIQRGVRRDTTRWTIAMSKSGGVRIYIPVGHRVSHSGQAKVFFGKGSDAGWMMIRSSDVGGRVIGVVKASGACFLQFSTLPFLPKGIKMSERLLEIVDVADTPASVKVRLPWLDQAGKPLPQQVWDQAA